MDGRWPSIAELIVGARCSTRSLSDSHEKGRTPPLPDTSQPRVVYAVRSAVAESGPNP